MILTGNWSHTCPSTKAAEILHRSPNTLCRWRRDGRGPLYRRKSNGRIEYSMLSVYHYSRRATAVDTAEYLGISTAHLGRMRRHGNGPDFKEERGIPKYHSDDVLEYEDKIEARSYSDW